MVFSPLLDEASQIRQRYVQRLHDLPYREPGRVRLRTLDPRERHDGQACVVGERLLRAALAFTKRAERTGEVTIGTSRAGHPGHGA